MDKKRLQDILQSFSGQQVLVLGDLMVDEYIWGKASRISPEAPVPVVEVGNQTFVLGGAANVANNIHSLGGTAHLVGVIGGDRTGEKIKERLDAEGLTIEGILLDDSRPTTLKTRVLAHNQQVVRIDREDKSFLNSKMEEVILSYLAEKIPQIAAVVISDYGKGVITPLVAAQTIALARKHGKPIAVDPKGTDYNKYKGATIITPNKKEAETALNIVLDTEEKLVFAGQKLRDSLELDYLLITRGEEGMSLFADSVFHVPAVASKVYDVTGAGDTVISTLILSLASGASLPDATLLSNYAAAVVVKKVGTSTVSSKEIEMIMKSGEENAREN